jgi:hypothetical protein
MLLYCTAASVYVLMVVVVILRGLSMLAALYVLAASDVANAVDAM